MSPQSQVQPHAAAIIDDEAPATRPPTPYILPYFDASFYSRLCHDLRLLQAKEEVREEIYGSLAADSRVAHTPPALRDQFQSDEHHAIRQFMAIMTPPTPSTGRNTPTLLTPGASSLKSIASPTPPATPSLAIQGLVPTTIPSLKRKRTEPCGDEQDSTKPKKHAKPRLHCGPLRRSLRSQKKNHG